ncbi:WG repeat-containing protein [Serpentinicella sp. ANB-PHB4]|uniref:WG repeat-containing protein n=1 Tax=Serpentinicella sp. ANB-PHB4 TaxID=3074076 RepID=UPI0028570BD6|nr:WG repeat-containing protein [Serpentinicella sp. ANB-PHB4]MDR5658945.1 WG repeat-containing protein [Serpentinicella sp. ANB-PHB4]
MLWDVVQHFLPEGAELIIPKKPLGINAIETYDLDGDGNQEVIVSYKYNNEALVMVLKDIGEYWQRVSIIRGNSHDLDYLNVANIIDEQINLMIGWKNSNNKCDLNIYVLKEDQLLNVTRNVEYSLVEIEQNKKSKQDCLIIWKHIEDSAYEVDIFKSSGNQLVSDHTVYHDYFSNVVSYYEVLVDKEPNNRIYWYYLADAQIKARNEKDALESIKRGKALRGEYPSIEDFNLLKTKVNISKNDNDNIINKGTRSKSVTRYPASVNKVGGIKWGYVNNEGSITIDPIFDSAQDFQDNNLSIVSINNKAGIIDDTGNFVVKPVFDSISEFHNERAVVWNKEGSKLIDTKGKVIFQTTGYLDYIIENRGAFGHIDSTSNQIKYGFIDKNGNIVVKPKFMSVSPFANGKAIAQVSERKFIMINYDGEVLHSYEGVALMGNLSEGVVSYKESLDGKFGYMDESGEILIPPKFDIAGDFIKGVAIVANKERGMLKHRIIDKHGKIILNGDYNSITLINEEKIAIGKTHEQKSIPTTIYAVADNNGRLLTDFMFTNINKYYNGYASVTDQNNTYFIDREGKRSNHLPTLDASCSMRMLQDLIEVNKNNELFYIDKKGRTIYRPNNIITLTKQYEIEIKEYVPKKNYTVNYPYIRGIEDKTIKNYVNDCLEKMSFVNSYEQPLSKNTSYSGGFTVGYYKKNLVSLKLWGYDYPVDAAHGIPSQMYAHTDLETGRFYKLKDLFIGRSYMRILSEIIRKQILASENEKEYWIDEYKGIKENQSFFITENSLKICFGVYEIGPYALGFPSFEIPFNDIMNIIDAYGEFWLSFNDI